MQVLRFAQALTSIKAGAVREVTLLVAPAGRAEFALLTTLEVGVAAERLRSRVASAEEEITLPSGTGELEFAILSGTESRISAKGAASTSTGTVREVARSAIATRRSELALLCPLGNGISAEGSRTFLPSPCEIFR